MFDNINDAKLRLNGTVVMYGDSPVYVGGLREHVDGVIRLYIKPIPNNVNVDAVEVDVDPDGDDQEILNPFLPKGDRRDPMDVMMKEKGFTRKKINSPRFNKFKAFPLGYCNYLSEKVRAPCFLSRPPLRVAYQGLKVGDLTIAITDNENNFSRSNLANSEGFAECCRGDYPSIEEARAVISDQNNNVFGVAVSRNFAIVRYADIINTIHYKGNCVGSFVRDVVELKQDSKYLKEAVELAGFKVE